MDLQAKIEEFKAKTKEIIESNPGVYQVQWQIKDIPFEEFKAFVESKGKRLIDIDQVSTGAFFFIPYYGHDSNGCQVTLMSLPVKLKRVVELIEVE